MKALFSSNSSGISRILLVVPRHFLMRSKGESKAERLAPWAVASVDVFLVDYLARTFLIDINLSNPALALNFSMIELVLINGLDVLFIKYESQS